MYFKGCDLPFRCKICFKKIKTGVKAENLIADIVGSIDFTMNDKKIEAFPQLVCKSCHMQLIKTRNFMQKVRHSQQILHCILDLEKNRGPNSLCYYSLPDCGDIAVLINVENDSENVANDIEGTLVQNDDEENKWNTTDDCFIDCSGSSHEGQGISDGNTGKDEIIEENKGLILQPEVISKEENVGKCDETNPFPDNSSQSGVQLIADNNIEAKKFLCWFCGQSFKLESRLNKHVSKFCPGAHSPDILRKNRRIVCELCGQRFLYFGHLNLHKKWHTYAKYSCDLCFQSFITKNLLEKHIKKLHLSSNSAQCSFCNSWLSSIAHLKNHVKRKHPGSYKKQKNEKENLIGNKTNILCSECGKAFKCSLSYKRHQLLHTGIKNYPCASCTSEFYTKSELVRHRRYKHDEAKKYFCTECNAYFVEAVRYKIHLRKHKGDRAFACCFCKKSYFSKSLLNAHLLKKHKGRVYSAVATEK